MQKISWYIRRLRSMAPSEIVWRLKSASRDVFDRYRIPAGCYPSLTDAFNTQPENEFSPPFTLFPLNPGDVGHFNSEWLERLTSKADLICQHRLSFFDLKDHFIGDPIDWHRDHGIGKAAPVTYAGKIDYRDFGQTGDCKLVWEPSRHHQLVVLARAYRVTGDLNYAQEIINQIESWLERNPFGFGMNWRSPLELAIRMINWVWALDLIRESGLLSGETRKRILYSVYLHLWEITRKFSQGSSANNHLIGEAAGVFIASCYFSELKDADKWRAQSQAILAKEIHQQTYADGCNKELAYGYQLFVMQFVLFSGIIARQAGCDFTEDFWGKLAKMMEFSSALGEAGGLPNYGDADDGYVLDLGATHSDAKYLLSAGAILFNRPEFKAQAGEFPEPVFWLLGPESIERYKQLPGSVEDQLVSRAFLDSGIYLLQCGDKNKNEQISVLFDGGELGFQSIAAHGHADALSFTLRVGGEYVFVDSGTFDYFTFPEWRRYFRQTRAHNTVEIDALDQSEMLGPFMWGKRAVTRCLAWSPGPDGQGGVVSAEHDGYKRLPDPVTHRRTLALDRDGGRLTLKDEILAHDLHRINLYFHLGAGCTIIKTTDKCYEISTKLGNKSVIEFDNRFEVEIMMGSVEPILGWFSKGYHHKIPINTLRCSASISGTDSFSTLIYRL